MNIFKKVANWAEENKFWADIIKGAFAAILIATIIESVKNSVGYSAEKDKARLSLKVNSIKDFAEKSYKYTSLAVRYKEGKITFTELRDAYDNYRAAEHLMNVSLEDPFIARKTQHIADEMLSLINNKDSVLNDQDLFERIRVSIKKESDSLEVYALKEKL